MKIEVTLCKDCIYFITEHCVLWNKPTKQHGYCHNAETEEAGNEQRTLFV
jgi:hypothetical protein